MSQILRSTPSEKHFKTISIMIVSNSLYLAKIKESLKQAHINLFNDDFKLVYVKANAVEDVLNLNIPIDFIVFIVDTSTDVHIKQVQNDLNLLDKSFFIGRICIVNATNFLQNIHVKDLQILSADYKIPVINGDIHKPNNCKILGERIIRLLHANLLEEIPFVPWATKC